MIKHGFGCMKTPAFTDVGAKFRIQKYTDVQCIVKGIRLMTRLLRCSGSRIYYAVSIASLAELARKLFRYNYEYAWLHLTKERIMIGFRIRVCFCRECASYRCISDSRENIATRISLDKGLWWVVFTAAATKQRIQQSIEHSKIAWLLDIVIENWRIQ